MSYRELLTNVLAANLTQVSIRQNEDVRKISAWAAIIAVPTLITGIYGMNFEHMPELTWRFGYPAALASDGVGLPGPLPLLPQGGLALARPNSLREAFDARFGVTRVGFLSRTSKRNSSESVGPRTV